WGLEIGVGQWVLLSVSYYSACMPEPLITVLEWEPANALPFRRLCVTAAGCTGAGQERPVPLPPPRPTGSRCPGALGRAGVCGRPHAGDALRWRSCIRARDEFPGSGSVP